MIKIEIVNDQTIHEYGSFVGQNVDSYACEECRHVDLYAPQSLIEEAKKNQNK